MVVISGVGRSGSNLILEVLTGSKFLIPSDPPEDKMVFSRRSMYRNNYLTKCDLVYTSWSDFSFTMNINPHCKIIYPIRDPRDMAISKIYRGWKKADDATSGGCIGDLFNMYGFYRLAISHFGDRLLLVKMENVILDIENEAKRMCRFLEIEYEENMKYPHTRMRHEGKKNRYKSLDRNQISMYKKVDTVYDGFFIENKINIEYVFRTIAPIVSYFGYNIWIGDNYE
uniref:Putative sulfotransferase domain contining protein n=1 Tax=viral metagenome TaxID=1070528 RepID=A0A6M3JYC5_9ZZZZ